MRLPQFTKQRALQKALENISYQLEYIGKNINDCSLTDGEFKVEEREWGSKEIDKLKISVPAEDLESIAKLTIEQKNAYNLILERVICNKPGASFFFYLFILLLLTVLMELARHICIIHCLALLRSRGYIALATASSDITTSILPGGCTAFQDSRSHLIDLKILFVELESKAD